MIGFLHTADVHVPTFDGLVDSLGSTEIARHAIVDPQLLHDAQERGPSNPVVIQRLDDHLTALAQEGATIVVCTCSTVGGEAERRGEVLGLKTIRVDRAMAEIAVANGPKVAVVATVESTLSPTSDLLTAVAAQFDLTIDLRMHLCADAWPKFLAGDQAGYLAAVAKKCEAIVDGPGEPVDVIVLAQASMMAAADLLSLPIPVLSSPAPAVDAALAYDPQGGQ